MSDGINPFGDPDGSKLDISLLTETFVVFENERAWGGLALRPDDLTARVLVGSKGSGKTSYQRRQRDHTRHQRDIYSVRREQEPPLSDQVLEFWSLVRDHKPTEFWKLAWNRAILRATVTQILANKQLRSRLEPETERSLREDFKELLQSKDPERDPMGVFSELKAILNNQRTFNAIRSYLMHDEWRHLKVRVADAIRQIPPLCFYLDSVDEHFETAPAPWLQCQVGLFLAIMDLVQDDRFSSLHIFAALRDTVLLSIRRSEHGSRFLEERYIRRLDWDMKAMQYLLEHKCERLPDDVCASPRTKGKPLYRWLGISEKKIPRRNGGPEAIGQYLLRHTRLLPRDLVILGNWICHEVAHAQYFPGLSPDKDPLREAVHAAASDFGVELLGSCAHHLLVEAMPLSAIKHGYVSVYLDKTAGIHREIVNNLRHFLLNVIGTERFTARKLASIETAGAKIFGDGIDVMTAMWLSGLVGVMEDPKTNCVQFHSHRHAGDMEFPRHRKHFVLHSSMIDAVGIRPTGAAPVPCS